jgi:hypothetical protein
MCSHLNSVDVTLVIFKFDLVAFSSISKLANLIASTRELTSVEFKFELIEIQSS